MSKIIESQLYILIGDAGTMVPCLTFGELNNEECYVVNRVKSYVDAEVPCKKLGSNCSVNLITGKNFEIDDGCVVSRIDVLLKWCYRPSCENNIFGGVLAEQHEMDEAKATQEAASE